MGINDEPVFHSAGRGCRGPCPDFTCPGRHDPRRAILHDDGSCWCFGCGQLYGADGEPVRGRVARQMRAKGVSPARVAAGLAKVLERADRDTLEDRLRWVGTCVDEHRDEGTLGPAEQALIETVAVRRLGDLATVRRLMGGRR